MTRVNDIACWEVLNLELPCSHLDSLPGFFDSSGAGLECPAADLSGPLFLVFMLSICLLVFARPRKEDHIHTRATLRALLDVIAPTCSLWPSRYIKLASIFCSRVDIPLEVIIEDTTDGVIEFCNPTDDLVVLIGPGVTVNGHTICINIGWKWWINCLEWWMLFKLRSGYMLGQFDWLHNNMPAINSGPLGLSMSSFVLRSSALNPLLCLDYLPGDTIPPLNAGCKVTLEFTAFPPSLRMLSTSHMLSAVPFAISEHSRRRPRTLVSVLKQLNALYGSNLIVNSLSNVSNDYENVLRHVYISSRKQEIRDVWVKNQGIKAWRRDMFLVAFEAALVRRGWIERWAVQVTVK